MSYTASYIVNSSSAQGTTDFTFTFPYIKEAHLEVYLNYNKINQGTASGEYQVITNVSPKLIRLNTGLASANLRVEVRRNSSLGTPLVDYADGSTLTANDLDTSALQSLYIDQELKDNQGKTVSVDEDTGLPSLGESGTNLRLTNVADPTAAQDAATKNYVDTKQFASAQIVDGTIVNTDVNASAAIAGTKISPNFGSQNIVTSGTVDGRDVSNDGIKLDSIETGATADQTNAEIRTAVEAASDSNVFTDADHSKLNAIEAGATADQTNAEIRTAVEAATDSNVFTDADHSKLNAIEASATADQTSGEIKTLLQSDKLTASEIADGTITSTQIATGALDGRYYTETESDARYFNVSTGDTIKDGDTFPDNDTTIATTAAINDRIIDLVDDVGGFVPIANETSFPNANPDVNNGTGTIVSIGSLAGNLTSNGSGVITIANGTVGNSTVTINGAANSTTYSAGYGLLVETTSTLNTYTFHRLSSKATEVSTVAGNISNINAVANNTSNINSAVSNASNINSAVSNASNINSAVSNASNITTVAGNNSNINTVAAANSNISTVAGSISNVNNVGGSIANVNTVATNISNVNDFSDKYRVASSAPSSNNDTGDLYFDTSSNELRVYNGSSWQGGVTATGNLAGLGANTFTGNQSLGDNLKVQLGASNDLQIQHNSNGHSYFDNNTGVLHIRARGSASGISLQPLSGEQGIEIDGNGAVELYYDDSKKFSTHNTGVEVLGDFFASGKVDLLDNGKLMLGTGDDLQIWHDSTSSFIRNATGDVYIQNNNSGTIVNNVILRAGTGATDLYFDNSKKFETTSSGVYITGAAVFPDGSSNGIKIGDHSDLQLFHDGSNSFIKEAGTGSLFIYADGTYLKNAAGNENLAAFVSNGAVELYYDNSKKFETTSAGAKTTGDLEVYAGSIHVTTDNQRLRLGGTYGGSGDLEIYHDGTHNYIASTNGGDNLIRANYNKFQTPTGENCIETKLNGAVDLFYDNSKKLETTTYGTKVTGRIAATTSFTGSDNVKLMLGDSDDLQIYHDASHSYINNTGTGNLYIVNDNGGTINLQTNGQENAVKCIEDGAVELYYDSSKKFETTSGGVNITGALNVNGAALSSGMPVHTSNGASVGVGEAFLMTSNSVLPSGWSVSSSSFQIPAGQSWIGQWDARKSYHSYIGGFTSHAYNASSATSMSHTYFSSGSASTGTNTASWVSATVPFFFIRLK